MTRLPDWLDADIVAEIGPLFAEYGGSAAVAVISTPGGDEAVFVVTGDGAEGMRDVELATNLQARLGRKVWIITDSSAWPVEPVAFWPLEDVPPR